jgi:CBS domain-containing protein
LLESGAMNAKDALNKTKAETLTIEPQRSLLQAIRKLVESNQGALVVVDRRGKIQGILTERDILKANAELFNRMRTLTVADLATKEVVIGLSEDPVEALMATMVEVGIRHLPILSRGKLLGMLSMRELVALQTRPEQVEVRRLEDHVDK